MDTNVVVAALLKDGIVRSTLLRHPKTFACALESLAEIWEPRDEWNRRGLPKRDLTKMLRFLVRQTLAVETRRQPAEQVEALSRVVGDADDAPVAALAHGAKRLWTFNPRGFAGFSGATGVVLLSTGEVLRLLRAG